MIYGLEFGSSVQKTAGGAGGEKDFFKIYFLCKLKKKSIMIHICTF